MNSSNVSILPTLHMQVSMGLIWLVVATVGLLGNVLVICMTLTNAQVMRQYVWISFNMAVTDSLILGIMMFWFVPLTLASAESLAVSGIGRRITSFSHAFWFQAVNLTVLMSMNRFVSVWFPIKYAQVFSETNTKIYLTAIHTLTWVVNMATFVRDDCQQYYDPLSHSLPLIDSDCSRVIRDWMSLYWKLLFFPICLLIDSVTFLKLKFRKVHVEGHNEVSKRRKELKFIFQSLFVITWTLTMLCLLNMVAPTAFADPWAEFWLVPMTWTSEYLVNGYVMLICNENNWRAFKATVLRLRSISHISTVTQVK